MKNKFLGMIITIFIVSILIFVFFNIIPADVAIIKLGTDATLEDIELLRKNLNLDKPLFYRYFLWIKGLLGLYPLKSLQYDILVLPYILKGFLVTLSISVIALLYMFVFVIIGVFLLNIKIFKEIVRFFSMFTMALPTFILAILLGILFGGNSNPFVSTTDMNVLENLSRFNLPAIAIAIPRSSIILRYIDDILLNKKKESYILNLRARGESIAVINRHIIKNNILPIITMFGMAISEILIGSVVVEQVFSLPGIAKIMMTSILNRDINVSACIILYIALIIIIINYILDIIYVKVDKRLNM